MKRSIFFCKSWFMAKRKPTEVWTAVQARAAHEAGQPYTVLVDSLESPFCTVDVTAQFVGVEFLDERLREVVTYHFQETSPGKLFLTMATYREFVDSSDKVSNGTTYTFAQDGKVQIRREFFVPEHRLETSTSEVDVSSNYSARPDFGEYDDLIQIDRSQAPVPIPR